MDTQTAREQFIQNGYDPIPLKPKSKVPFAFNWQEQLTFTQWHNAPHDANIGLRAGSGRSFIDCDNDKSPETFQNVTRWIESVTWDYIMKLIKDPQKFEEKLKEAQANEAETMRPKQKELEHVIALLKDTEREAEEVAQTAKKIKGIVGAKLEKQAEEIDKRYQALTKHKIELQNELAVELSDSTINNLLEFRETVALGLDNPTCEDRRRWLEILQATVTVTKGMAVVTCRLGGSRNYRLSEFLFTRKS